MATRGCPCRNSATACAFSQCARIRKAIVFTPRRESQVSNGEGTAPHALFHSQRCFAIASSFVTAAPPITSEWPEMYFVVECTTTSAPRSKGFWSAGEANVLSNTTVSPCRFASAHTARTSDTRTLGLVGVSKISIRVFGLTAAEIVEGSCASKNAVSMPCRVRCPSAMRNVPP